MIPLSCFYLYIMEKELRSNIRRLLRMNKHPLRGSFFASHWWLAHERCARCRDNRCILILETTVPVDKKRKAKIRTQGSLMESHSVAVFILYRRFLVQLKG